MRTKDQDQLVVRTDVNDVPPPIYHDISVMPVLDLEDVTNNRVRDGLDINDGKDATNLFKYPNAMSLAL